MVFENLKRIEITVQSQLKLYEFSKITLLCRIGNSKIGKRH